MGLMVRLRQLAGNVCSVLFLAIAFTLLPGQLWTESAYAATNTTIYTQYENTNPNPNFDTNNITSEIIDIHPYSGSNFDTTINSLITTLTADANNLVSKVAYEKIGNVVYSVYINFFGVLTGSVNSTTTTWVYDTDNNKSKLVPVKVWQPPRSNGNGNTTPTVDQEWVVTQPEETKTTSTVITVPTVDANGKLTIPIPTEDIIKQVTENKSDVLEFNAITDSTVPVNSAVITLPKEVVSVLSYMKSDVAVNYSDVHFIIPHTIFETPAIESALLKGQDIKFEMRIDNVPATKLADLSTPENTKGLNGIGRAFDIKLIVTIDNKELDASATVSGYRVVLPYNANVLNGDDPRLLGLYFFNTKKKMWEYTGGDVHLYRKTVTTELQHLSDYSLMTYRRNYQDISKHWAKDAIMIATAKHFVVGNSDTAFRPNDAVTVNEFTAMLTGALRLTGNAHNSFNEVFTTAWNKDAAAIAKRSINYKGKILKSTDTISRQEMYVMIARALVELKTVKLLSDTESTKVIAKFSDYKDVPQWAKRENATLIKHKLLFGRTALTSDPKGNATRAEATAFVLRTLYKMLGH